MKSVQSHEEGYPSHMSLDACILGIGKCFLSMEHEQGYGSICSFSEDQRG